MYIHKFRGPVYSLGLNFLRNTYTTFGTGPASWRVGSHLSKGTATHAMRQRRMFCQKTSSVIVTLHSSSNYTV